MSINVIRRQTPFTFVIVMLMGQNIFVNLQLYFR